MKFAFYTLGCKVNQYETQAMEQLLAEKGHTLGQFDEPCDGYIVNTCTVTGVSDKKSRAAIRQAKKRNPAAVVGVCGCYSQTAPADVRALGVDVLAGTSGREEFLDSLISAAETRRQRELVQDVSKPLPFERLPAGGLPERTRALLKIEDGCDNFCAYCVIPYARGRVRSLPLAAAAAEARALSAAGYREIVVNGIEISSWGKDLGGEPLETLLAALLRAVPETRVRLGSLEPRTVTPEFCAALKDFPNLCPQFHLSLQSGSDAVLRRMRRKYDAARYRTSVRLLREAFPGCAVTTDLIVGFPGETEAEFAESLAFVRACGLSAFHIFPYSRRKGTPAAAMPGQLTNAVKQERARRAAETARELETEYLTRQLGTLQKVLFEQPEDGYFAGHAPNYVKVYVPDGPLHNELRSVRITGLFRDGLLGELAGNEA